MKNTSVLVGLVFLQVACQSGVPNFPDQPPRGDATQRVNFVPLDEPPTPVADVDQDAVEPPAQTNAVAAEAIPVDRMPEEAQGVKNAWNSAFYAHRDSARLAEAKKRGFTRLAVGLETTVEETIDGALSLNELKRTAIYLGGRNDLLKIDQVMGELALVITDRVNFMFKGPRDHLYEGTPIHQLGMYWKVTGTTTYRSVLGTKQAFMITTIDPIEPDESKVWQETLATLQRGDGTVSAARIEGVELVECIDGPLKQLQKLPAHLYGLADECHRVFTRPPRTTCRVPEKATIYGHGLPLAKEECEGMGGMWTTTSAGAQTAQ